MDQSLKIKYSKIEIECKACKVFVYNKKSKKEKESYIDEVVAVDLTNSKSLYFLNCSMGIAVYNENKYGFYISIEDIDKTLEEYKNKELKYKKETDKEVLDDIIDLFKRDIIQFLSSSKLKKNLKAQQLIDVIINYTKDIQR